MEFLQMQYFLDSAENENFSVTAKKYLVSTSSVSASIKKLEGELNCKLFDRSANKIVLNKHGKIFYDAVKSAFSIIDKAKGDISPISNSIQDTIRLLIRSERSLLNERILEFNKIYPNVNFRLTHSFITHDVKHYDIIIDELSDSYRMYIRKPLITEKIKIAVSKNNALCNKRLTLNELKNMPFITMSNGSSLSRITKEICNKAGFEPNIVIECDDPLYIRKYIASGFGICLFPEKSWGKEITDDIKYLDIIDFDYSRTVYAYLNSLKQQSPISKKFFEYI